MVSFAVARIGSTLAAATKSPYRSSSDTNLDPDMGTALHKLIPGVPYWVERSVDGLFQDGDMETIRADMFERVGLSEFSPLAGFKTMTWADKKAAAVIIAAFLMNPVNDGILQQLVLNERIDTAEARESARRRERQIGMVAGAAVAIAGAAAVGSQLQAQNAARDQAALTGELDAIAAQEAKAEAAQTTAARSKLLPLLLLAGVAVAVIFLVRG